MGAGRIATTFFGIRRAAAAADSEVHISRSRVCKLETACKGVRSVPVVYRDSKPAEDQEAGPVGAPGQWPVRQAGGGCPLSAPMSDRTSLLSDVRNDVGTLGLRYPYILILSPILARMSATISVYPDIVSNIRSYIRYDIRDVPDLVGGKNRVNLNIGPDIGV